MYDCNEAQQLLHAGIRPAARPPERALLGFHIVNCVNCQAVLRSLQERENALLLASLLADTPPEPIPSTKPKPRRTRAMLIGAVLCVLAMVGFGMWWLGYSHATQSVAQTVADDAPSLEPVVVAASTAVPAQPVVAIVTPTTTLAPTSQPPTSLPTDLPTQPIQPTNTSVATQAPTPQTAPPMPLGSINILLLGLDRRPGETEPARADSLMVLHISPFSNTVAMLSLPRDLWVTLPEPYNFPVKLNAAYMNGEIDGGAAGGADLARQTVSSVIGQPIDYVVVTTFEGLTRTVDRVGGVDINVEKEIYDPSYPTFDYGYMVAHFVPGRQHMDGATALIYSRTRHADNDFERGKRQQQVVLALAANLRQTIATSDLVTQLGLIGDLQTDLEYTNIDTMTLGQLLVLMPQVQPELVRRDSVDLRYGYESSTYDGAYIIEPDLPAIQQLVADLFSGQ